VSINKCTGLFKALTTVIHQQGSDSAALGWRLRIFFPESFPELFLLWWFCWSVDHTLRTTALRVYMVYIMHWTNASFFIFCAWGTLWHLQKFSQYIKYMIHEFTPLCHSPLFPLPPFPE
jgi:hypothetical protein